MNKLTDFMLGALDRLLDRIEYVVLGLVGALLVFVIYMDASGKEDCRKACAPQKLHQRVNNVCACEAEGRELRMVRP